MKSTTLLGFLAILLLSACTSNNLTESFEYAITQPKVVYNQSSSVELNYAGQIVSTKVQLQAQQNWSKSGTNIIVETQPIRIKMTQEVPFVGSISYDSELNKPKTEQSEAELILKEEVENALNSQKSITITPKGKVIQKSEVLDIEDFSANPFLFLEFPTSTDSKSGWDNQVVLESNIPSLASMHFQIIEQDSITSTIQFEGTLDKYKNQKAEILGVNTLVGTISGELVFDIQKQRITSGFYTSNGKCDMQQMNKTLQLEFQIQQQFIETVE